MVRNINYPDNHELEFAYPCRRNAVGELGVKNLGIGIWCLLARRRYAGGEFGSCLPAVALAKAGDFGSCIFGSCVFASGATHQNDHAEKMITNRVHTKY
jgi:hypothetical protein